MAQDNVFPASRELFKFVRALAGRQNPDQKKTGDIEIGRIVGFESARTSRWKHGRIVVNDAPRLLALSHALDVDFTLLCNVAAGYFTAKEALSVLDSESELTHFIGEQIMLPENNRVVTVKSGDGTQTRIIRRGPGRYDRKTQRSSATSEVGSGEQYALLVDDDPSAIGVFKNLTGRGTGIIGKVARSGTEALILGGRYRPQLIVFDLFIGDVDGFKAIRTLSSNDTTRTALTVATSMSINAEIMRRSFGSGAADVQPRPLEASTLERLLDRVRRQEIT